MSRTTTLSRMLADVARRVGSTLELHRTLEQITDAVVDLLGFEVAVLNLATPDGLHLEAVSVAGPQQVRDELLGTRMEVAHWERLLADCVPLGLLRFADHLMDWPEALPYWLPDLEVTDDAEAWHPEDALFAPLHGGDGTLLGVLSVDVPVDGRRPAADRRELLELFTVQASLALEHARLHDRLQQTQAVFQRTFEHAPVGMAVFDAERRFLRVNPAYCAFLGRTEQQLLGLQVCDVGHPDDRALTLRASEDVRRTGRLGAPTERRYLHADGSVVWGRVTLTRLDGDQVLAHLEDITVARAVAAQLEERASSDPLTGLGNRHRFDTVLSARLLRGGSRVAVLFCDVDRFKRVNDTLGHAAGDALLQQIAQAVAGQLRAQDLAARLGGDEFVLLLDDVASDAEAVAVAERVRRAVSSGPGAGTITVGVAVSDASSTARSLLARADGALYLAKQQGRDRVALAGPLAASTPLVPLAAPG